MLHTNEVADISERMIEQNKLLVFYQEGGIYMKQDTLEGKAKTKNGVKRLCFSIICILLEVIFIITIVTRLNEYAEIINLFTRILSGILVLGLYASNKTSSMKMPWVILILIFPIMGVGLYLLIGLNGGTHKMRE